jgi:SAM-dependent methyltransferase
MSANACPCCQGALSHPGWGPPSLRVCAACGSGFLPPDAAPSAEAYDAGYFDGSGAGGVDYEGSKRQFQLINHKRLDVIEAYAGSAPRRLFELGCALGFFMEAAQERGWEPWGVELSAFAAAKAQQRFGDRVLCGTLQQAPAEWRAFGMAAAFHVAEHLPDPRGEVAEMAARLAPGGLLVLEVPDFGSRTAQRARDGWKYFLPGEHLNYFTQAGLRALLEAQGLEVLRFEPTSFTRLLGGLDKAGLKRAKELLLKALRWLAWVKWLVLKLRGLRGGHDCVLVIARKPLGGPA